MAAYTAAGILNEGITSLLYYMSSVGISLGLNAHLYAEKEDAERVTIADRRSRENTHEERMARRQHQIWIIRSCLDSGGFIIWTWNRWLDVSWKKKCLLCVKYFWNFKRVFLKTMFLKSVSKISRKWLNRLGSNFYTSFININDDIIRLLYITNNIEIIFAEESPTRMSVREDREN